MAIRQFINEFLILFTAIKDGIVFVFVSAPSSIFNALKNQFV